VREAGRDVALGEPAGIIALTVVRAPRYHRATALMIDPHPVPVPSFDPAAQLRAAAIVRHEAVHDLARRQPAAAA